MMHKLLLGGLIALALGGSAAAQNSAYDQWIGTLGTNNWTYMGGRFEPVMEAVFYKSGGRLPNGHPMMWSRYEYSAPQNDNISSYVELDEYDCVLGRQRLMQKDQFEGNNLGSFKFHSTNGAWEYPIPNTFGDLSQKAACQGATRKAAPARALR